MAWQRQGTVSCTQNSPTVTGAGTAFVSNSRVGDAFLGPDGRWYEVTNIASDGVLAIQPVYQGTTVAAGTYAIVPIQGYNKASADALRLATKEFTEGTSSASENAAKAEQSAAAALESQGAAAGAADTATEKAQVATSAASTATQQAQAAAGDRQAADSAATNAGKSASDAKGYRDQAAQSAASIDTSKLVNKAGDTIAGPLNWAPRVDVADSATPAIGAAASNSVNLIGTTTVTGFDALASGVRLVRFNASRTLRHEAGKLDLVGGADLMTAAGDTALFEARGSNGWRMAFYQRKDGKALKGSSDGNAQILKATSTAVGQTTFNFPTGYTVGSPIWYQGTLLDSQDYTATDGNNVVLQVGAKSVGEIMTLFNVAGTLVSDPTKLPLSGGQMQGALDFQAPITIADSATPAIGASGSNNVVLAGTTTITAFDVTAAGAIRWVKFSGSRLLNHDATKLALLGGVNIQTNAGDMAVFRSLGGGNWEMLDYTASLPPGSIFSKEWTSANQAISSNGRITLAHGMNVVPKMSSLELICLVANAEYSVGDVIPLPNAQGTSANFGYQLKWSTANVVIMYAAANLLVLVNSGTWTTLNTAQWAVRVRAWA